MNNGTFIPPEPKEYITYSEQEKIEKTEINYQKLASLYQRIGNSQQEYICRINHFLQKGVTRKEIMTVLYEKEAQILCHYSYEFYILKTLCNIAELEENLKGYSVLKNVYSMDDAVWWQQRCVFLLRRFEMDWEWNEELLSLVQTGQVSYILLAELICKEWISRKIHTGSEVARYLYENGLKKEALLFLLWLERRLPYSERKIMVFAMTLLDMEERKLAYETLMKYQNPSDEINELQEKLRGIQ